MIFWHHQNSELNRFKAKCLVNGDCLTKEVVYKATVVHQNKKMIKIVSAWRTFEERFYEYKQSFRSAVKKYKIK